MSASQGDREGAADDAPSDAEQHAAQALLAQRLEDLFHGIQTTLFAQEMAAQQQLQSIADVWAATDRYRVAGHARGRGPVPGSSTEDQVAPRSDSAS
jgi:Protein of unknown function (DUF2587)